MSAALASLLVDPVVLAAELVPAELSGLTGVRRLAETYTRNQFTARELEARGFAKQAAKVGECCRIGQAQLLGPGWQALQRCGQRLLCPACARWDAGRRRRRYMARVCDVIEREGLHPIFLTLTIPNGPDLQERVWTLLQGWRTMVGRVRRARGGGRNKCSLTVCAGGVASVEVKRGENSGQWHPHLHALVLVTRGIDLNELRRDWAGLTAGSNIDARWVNTHKGLYRDIAEVLKYASKMVSMCPMDTVHAWTVCHGQRLMMSFGCLRGLDVEPEPVPENERGAVLVALERGTRVYRARAMGLPSEYAKAPF